MIDYIQLSQRHEQKRQNLTELARTAAAGILAFVLVAMVVFSGLSCVLETATITAQPVVEARR